MRGHQLLSDVRRAGFAPHQVNVDLDVPRLPLAHFADMARAGFAQLQVEPADAVHRLDLRCVVGLVVLVSGRDAERVANVAAACVAAGAERVIATTHETDDDPVDPTFTVVRVTDSAGVLTWPN